MRTEDTPMHILVRKILFTTLMFKTTHLKRHWICSHPSLFARYSLSPLLLGRSMQWIVKTKRTYRFTHFSRPSNLRCIVTVLYIERQLEEVPTVEVAGQGRSSYHHVLHWEHWNSRPERRLKCTKFWRRSASSHSRFDEEIPRRELFCKLDEARILQQSIPWFYAELGGMRAEYASSFFLLAYELT